MPASESSESHRLVSLDVFRGITIAGMILVNNPGSWSHVYGPLRHAEWHGFTPTDQIFPGFLFIVGALERYLPGLLGTITHELSLLYHFERFSRGVADTRDILYFVLMTIVPPSTRSMHCSESSARGISWKAGSLKPFSRMP